MEKFIAKKRYGQNFLTNESIINKIINSVDVNGDDLIIEIGPGKGALTSKLVTKGCQVLAFEIDLDTKPYLEKLDNLSVVYGDFLDLDLNQVLKKYKYNNVYIIANLPYYITTPIISKIIDSKINPKQLTLMVQKEVADRFSAKPGSRDYGYFTVKLNYFFNIRKLCDVKRQYFSPQPNVDSAVVIFETKEYNPNLYSKFDELITKSFRMKRKTLKNNLGADLFNKLLPELMNCGYGLDVRAEQIDLETYIKLAKLL